MQFFTRIPLVCGLLLAGLVAARAAAAPGTVEAVVPVASVWAGHPVGFALWTEGTNQWVAFYDTNRQMTVAGRTLPGTEWTFQKLPSRVGWDSHNYITLALDGQGQLHVAGNMHVHPLDYYRTRRAREIASLEKIPAMVGEREDRCTYPKFLRPPQGDLVFTYRDGRSGSGDQLLNVYDAARGQWRRLLSAPLFSGRGKMNAYYHGPVLGPDGYYHLCWMWRDTPDCASNHDLSYARSRDLQRWENRAGQPLTLPITLETGEPVDPVPAGGGLLNVNQQIGFDSRGRVVVTYHKYDSRGFLQAYAARLEGGQWKIHQVSDWNYRWEFSGGGTIATEVRVGAVERAADGQLLLNYSHAKAGGGTWILDEELLKPKGQFRRPNLLAETDRRLASPTPGLQWNSAGDVGHPPPGHRYQLRWQTLPVNRDRPRPQPWPAPTMLYLLELAAP
jgi:hypothetical protein